MEEEIKKLNLDVEELKEQVQSHTHDGVLSQNIQVDDVAGLINTVTTGLTARLISRPQTFGQQFFLYAPSPNSYGFYYFDPAGNSWTYFQGRSSSYAGAVGSDGSNSVIPYGWTTSKLSTGDYLVTHNLGTTNYAVTATLITASQTTIFIANKGSSSVEFYVKDTTGAFVDKAFNFIIVDN